MTTDGVISGYLNKGVGNMVNQGLIKHTEGKERKSRSHRQDEIICSE